MLASFCGRIRWCDVQDGAPPNSFRQRHQLGHELIQCSKHGLLPRAKEVCPKCLNTLWIEYKNLQKLLEQSPEFLQALAQRNQELYGALVSLESVEKEFGTPVVPSTRFEEAYIKMCDVIAFFISQMKKPMREAP